jgi:hypothetical protein
MRLKKELERVNKEVGSYLGELAEIRDPLLEIMEKHHEEEFEEWFIRTVQDPYAVKELVKLIASRYTELKKVIG